MSSISQTDNIKHVPPNNSDWWLEHVKYLKFRRQGIDIIGAKFEQKSGVARANTIVITDWSESFLKYSEIIRMLFERGFNVYTYDHQSQGLSGRWLPEPQSTWINSFDDYVDDFTFFVTAVAPGSPLPMFLVASSMGGLIGGIAMTRLPHLFKRAILLAPMFRNKCGMKITNYQWPFPQPLAYWWAKTVCYFGGGKMHCFGSFIEKPAYQVPLNLLSSCQLQMNIWDVLRRQYPNILSTCVSNDWLIHAIHAQQKFEARLQYIQTNTLIICAEHDYFVYNRAMYLFAQKVPTSKIFFAPNSYHEIWQEKDAIRGAALKAISDFFTQKSEDVSLVEPSAPLVVHDPTTPVYSMAEMAFRTTGIFLASLGVVVGITIVLGDSKRKS